MNGRRRTALLLTAGVVVALVNPGVAVAGHGSTAPPAVLASGLGGGSGSTLGPGGDLYVTEPLAHRVSRIDLRTGERTVVADCLPERAIPLGGAMDVAFLHGDMYVLTALVGPDVGGTGVTGIYRVEDGRCEVVADIGQWSIDNPPPPEIEIAVASGLPYAMQPYRGGFLVTDGHHNRVLWVSLDGDVHEVLQLDNVVPTGLERVGSRIWLSLAGPTPHLPEDGQLVSFDVASPEPRLEASGGRLLVDVEARGHAVYALSQGVFPVGEPAATPAMHDTGSLLRVDGSGFDVVAGGLDQPTSMEIRGHTAYVVTLDGEVWRVSLGHGHHG